MLQDAQQAKSDLLKRGFEIQFRLSSDSCECLICHSSWWTSNYGDATVIPKGNGKDEQEALFEAIKALGQKLSARYEQ